MNIHISHIKPDKKYNIKQKIRVVYIYTFFSIYSVVVSKCLYIFTIFIQWSTDVCLMSVQNSKPNKNQQEKKTEAKLYK